MEEAAGVLPGSPTALHTPKANFSEELAQHPPDVASNSGDDSLAAATSEATPGPAQLSMLPPPPPPAEPSSAGESATAPSKSPRRGSIEVSHSAPADYSPSKSWLRRAQNRAEELRLVFSLPPDESFLEDFMCALRKRMLLQGRMYVFSRHVCFQCNLFGYHKIKVIPLSEVVEVRKKKYVGFPNSLELTMASGKREFFTSFLARAEAYRLIMAQWRECSEHAPPEPAALQEDGEAQEGAEPAAAAAGVLARGTSVKQLFRCMLQREQTSPNAPAHSLSSPPLARMRGDPSPLQSVDEEGLLVAAAAGAAALPSPFARAATFHPGGGGAVRGAHTNTSSSGEDDPLRAYSPSQGGDPSTSHLLMAEGSSCLLGPPEDSYVAVGPGGSSPQGGGSETPAAAVRGSRYAGSSGTASPGRSISPERVHLQREFEQLSDLQCQRALEAELGQASEAPPPPPADPTMQQVLDFELPCTPSEFWCRFLSNGSDFLHRFAARRGDSSVRLSKWQRHFKVGLVRDLQFVTPVKARIGPPQAVCHQTQRLQVFAGQHLVLETSQVMSDIPYADHFSVEARWDVAPAGEGSSRVIVRLKVPFCKKTLWKGFIEKGTFDNMLESVHLWRELALETLAAVREKGFPRSRSGTMEAEWGALLSRSSGAPHARKHSRGASLSAGIPVGRQLPVLARHRRSPSRLAGVGEGPLPHSSSGNSLTGLGRPVSMSRLGSTNSACTSPTGVRHAQLSQQPSQQLPQQQPQQPFDETPAQEDALPRQPQQKQQAAGGVGSAAATAARVAAAPLLALLSWLLSLAGAAARAARAASGPGGVFLVGCVIIALQTAMLLQQRQQLAHLQSHQHAPTAAAAAAAQWAAPSLGEASSGGSIANASCSAAAAQQAAVAAEVLGQQLSALYSAVERLREQSDSWRGQLDELASAAAGLAAHLQHHHAAAAASVGHEG